MDEYARLRHWMDSWTLMKLGSDPYLKEEEKDSFCHLGGFCQETRGWLFLFCLFAFSIRARGKEAKQLAAPIMTPKWETRKGAVSVGFWKTKHGWDWDC